MKKLKVMIVFLGFIFVSLFAAHVSASTDVNSKITVNSSTYQKMDQQSDGTFVASTNTTLEPSQYINHTISAVLDNSDGSLVKGDYFTYTIDSKLQAGGINTETQNYNIYDGTTLIAEGIYDSDTKVITYYLTEAAANSARITLDVNIPLSLDRSVVLYNGTYSFTNTFATDSQTYSYDVYMDANSHDSRANIIQSNSLITETNLSTNRYTMVSYIHRYGGTNAPLKFSYSSYSTGGLTISPESNAVWKIYKPNDGYSLPDSYEADVSQMTDVTSQFTQTTSSDGYSTFTGSEAFETGDDYVVVLENDINTAAYGYIYSVLSVGSTTEGLVWKSTTSTVIDLQNSTGTLQSATIQIKKVDENGNALAGAVFDVYRLSTGEKVATVTTDDTGTATVTGVFNTQYEVKEVTAPTGYVLDTSSYTILASDFDSSTLLATLTVTNKQSTTSVNVQKIWDDNDNADGIRPENITVHLLANGEVVQTATITADSDGNWSHTFTDLPEYKDGQAITYTVAEDAVAGYTTTVDGYTIINTHEPEKTPNTPPSEQNSTSSTSESSSNKQSTKKKKSKTSLPSTGDSSGLGVVIVGLIIAVLGVTGLVFHKAKKTKK
ncbi:Cna B-type domain-containing protein [Streptococcus gallolyticus]|uniref:Collagen adhesin n=1 Tax=Streptococcus gallolyticus TaxID=315405 RepID=A0A139R330_9STRE|nr:Cna B-type domain-containing protein [Streptococcus gallolyticus]KXU09182.1 Collagen adhesin [Streptococcus gallolyticus]